MKILHFILFSSNEIFNNMYLITREYYKKIKNVKTIYYTYSYTIKNNYELNNDILYIKGNETNIPGILEKTIKCFEYFINEINNYDYIIRSNISTIVDLNKLTNYLINNNIEYGGGNLMELQWLDPIFGIKDNTWFGTKFAQGTSIIFSKNVLSIILDNIDKIDFNIIDDVAFGIFIKKYLLNIKPKGLNEYFFHCYEYSDINLLSNIVFNSDYIFYRNSNNDRNIDIKQMKYIVDNLLIKNYIK
jgi:hypothetical protein